MSKRLIAVNVGQWDTDGYQASQQVAQAVQAELAQKRPTEQNRTTVVHVLVEVLDD